MQRRHLVWFFVELCGFVFILGCNASDSTTRRNSGDTDSTSDPDTDAGADANTSAYADAGADAGIDLDFETPRSCDEARKLKSNIGCEYWAVDLDNSESLLGNDNAAGDRFAVAVANVGNQGSSHVEVHINNADPGMPLDLDLVETRDIAERDLYLFELPRRDVDGENVTVGVDNGPQTWLSSRAFRITSSVPVVAFQFNPLNQKFSNDASLLLPTSGLGKNHLVLGYPPSGPNALQKNRGYVTIVGTSEDTSVQVTPAFDIMAGEGIEAIQKGELAEFTIGPFDVINLETRLEKADDSIPPDLTGSTVSSDKSVAVFFGTDLSLVSNTQKFPFSCCAEHMEQQVLPSEAMGQKFVVSHSAHRNWNKPEEDMYRIMAYSDNTKVLTNLPEPNASFTLSSGQFREIFSSIGFVVDSTGPLHVGQYLVAQGDTGAAMGDSALLYVPAVNQRRKHYIFTTGRGFATNHAVISMPEGSKAIIDDEDLKKSPMCRGPIVDGELDDVNYEAWTCDILDGDHEVYSNAPIGVFVYGYYSAGSYAYPAGSDLRRINPDVVE
ncbi:MAG: hypothetical protein GY854_26845 [Deltaproteobacteria bacterium]|nr:hypothetical protein [Deltaproteobacteria bacterium]